VFVHVYCIAVNRVIERKLFTWTYGTEAAPLGGRGTSPLETTVASLRPSSITDCVFFALSVIESCKKCFFSGKN
jgi:hypothetical protein